MSDPELFAEIVHGLNMTELLIPDWEFIADGVMGGVSTGSLVHETREGREAVRLRGDVSVANNGGFLQMAFDVNRSGGVYDASCWSGIELDVLGNGQPYEVRLRTSELSKPWQSFRLEFIADARWTTLQMPFSAFTAHRHDLAFNPTQLCRVGVLAVGREFHADISVARFQFLNELSVGSAVVSSELSATHAKQEPNDK